MNYTSRELACIYKNFPDLKPLSIDIDTIVVEFLALHDVKTTPIDYKKTGAGSISNAAMGAISPAALAINQHLTQQQKAIAVQEWTSWKQWAMGHRDWPAFKEQKMASIEEHNARAKAFIDSPEGSAQIDEIISKFRVKKSIQNPIVHCYGLFSFQCFG